MGVRNRTRASGNGRSSPITQAMPSSCAASQAARIPSRSAGVAWRTGTPLARTETGTFASGRAARIAGSASAMTSSGVR